MNPFKASEKSDPKLSINVFFMILQTKSFFDHQDTAQNHDLY